METRLKPRLNGERRQEILSTVLDRFLPRNTPGSGNHEAPSSPPAEHQAGTRREGV